MLNTKMVKKHTKIDMQFNYCHISILYFEYFSVLSSSLDLCEKIFNLMFLSCLTSAELITERV
jgi:hypothetical protein